MCRYRHTRGVTPEQRAALEALVPAEKRTGDDETDLIAAVKEAGERRRRNTELGGAVIQALHDVEGARLMPDPYEKWSWRAIEAGTDIPNGTARRWAAPPEPPPADEHQEET